MFGGNAAAAEAPCEVRWEMGDGLGLGPLGGAVEKHQKHQKATAPGRASTMRCSFIFPSCTDWTGCVGLDLQGVELLRGEEGPPVRCPGVQVSRV